MLKFDPRHDSAGKVPGAVTTNYSLDRRRQRLETKNESSLSSLGGLSRTPKCAFAQKDYDDFVLRRMDATRKSNFEAHLAICWGCRNSVEFLEALRSVL